MKSCPPKRSSLQKLQRNQSLPLSNFFTAACVICMGDAMKFLIGMTSITYAMRAQELLTAKKIRSQVVSTPKNVGSGCGYSLSVSGDPNEVKRLLSENGIKYKEVYL